MSLLLTQKAHNNNQVTQHKVYRPNFSHQPSHCLRVVRSNDKKDQKSAAIEKSAYKQPYDKQTAAVIRDEDKAAIAEMIEQNA
jgi:hypothetical protein